MQLFSAENSNLPCGCHFQRCFGLPCSNAFRQALRTAPAIAGFAGAVRGTERNSTSGQRAERNHSAARDRSSFGTCDRSSFGTHGRCSSGSDSFDSARRSGSSEEACQHCLASAAFRSSPYGKHACHRHEPRTALMPILPHAERKRCLAPDRHI